MLSLSLMQNNKKYYVSPQIVAVVTNQDLGTGSNMSQRALHQAREEVASLFFSQNNLSGGEVADNDASPYKWAYGCAKKQALADLAKYVPLLSDAEVGGKDDKSKCKSTAHGVWEGYLGVDCTEMQSIENIELFKQQLNRLSELATVIELYDDVNIFQLLLSAYGQVSSKATNAYHVGTIKSLMQRYSALGEILRDVMSTEGWVSAIQRLAGASVW